MALDDYRDKDGELSRKHGNTLIGTLRSHYGSDFAAACSESDRLTDVLDQLDEASYAPPKSELYASLISRRESFSYDPPSGEHQLGLGFRP